jgi:hypothetical protein
MTSSRLAGYGNVPGFRRFMAYVCMEKALRVQACEMVRDMREGDDEPYPGEFVNRVWVPPEWATTEAKERAVEWMIEQGVKIDTYKQFHTYGVNLTAPEDYAMMGYDFRAWYAENSMGG